MDHDTEKLGQCAACRGFKCRPGEDFCEPCIEDRGWFRPSKIPLFELCPGSAGLIELLRPATEDSAAAARGTLMHLAMHSEEAYASLTLREQGLVLRAWDAGAEHCRHEGPLEDFPKIGRAEVPIVLRDGLGQAVTFGHADFVTENELIDWKFGPQDPDPNVVGVQGTIYAAGRAQETGATCRAMVYHAPTGQKFFRDVGPEMAASIVSQVKALRDRLRATDALELRPSPAACVACYCPVRASCPAVARQVGQIAAAERRKLSFEVMEHADLQAYLDRVPMVEQVCQTIRAVGKRRALEGETWRGWKVQTLPGNREVYDPVAAFSAAKKVEMDFAAFLSATDVSVTRLEKAYVDHRKKQDPSQKKKDLQAAFNEDFRQAIRRAAEKTEFRRTKS